MRDVYASLGDKSNHRFCVHAKSAQKLRLRQQKIRVNPALFKLFKTLHPAFNTLDKAEMTTMGLSAPLHPGALKYYKEEGLQ